MATKVYIRNSPDLRDEQGKWIKNYNPEPHVKVTTRAAVVWGNMTTRCSQPYKDGAPTYGQVCNGFLDFQDFAEWCQSQDGYNMVDSNRFWSLDKDLLLPGNKVYRHDTCIFVPNEVNTVLINPGDNGLLTGVSPYRYNRSKFTATCRNLNTRSAHLGVFDTEQQAHKAWQAAKIQVIDGLLLKYREYVKIVISLQGWRARLQADMDEGLPTTFFM